MYRILLGNWEEKENQDIEEYLTRRNLDVTVMSSRQDIITILKQEIFDFILLSPNIPRELIEELGGKAPVFWIKKPVSLPDIYQEIVAQIKKYYGREGTHYLMCGQIIMYLSTREVLIQGNSVKLPRKVYEVLRCLLENKERVLSRDEILNAVWGIDYFGDDRVVDTHIKKLRKALGEQGLHVQTVFKIGYILREGNI